ncbi:MAG: hypothetical protein LBG73_08155 [Spirochaetaceae bacterium]|jgi:hypothetical protein|nr:hypothetical protein [Spirochaetaceae bacterium]
MPNKDWLPHREQDFTDLCQKWKTGLSDAANGSAFGWKSSDSAAASAAVDAFLTARADYEANDSSKNRIKKDEAKEAAKTAMRDFANASIRYNKQMREEDRLFYGIHTPDGTHTPSVAPATYPEAEADTSTMRQVTLHFWDSGTKKRGKPHNVHGAEIRWSLLENPPESVNDLSNSDFDTASPFTLHFDEPDRGKRLYFCLRWASVTNLKGPFGEIYSVIIP